MNFPNVKIAIAIYHQPLNHPKLRENVKEILFDIATIFSNIALNKTKDRLWPLNAAQPEVIYRVARKEWLL